MTNHLCGIKEVAQEIHLRLLRPQEPCVATARSLIQGLKRGITYLVLESGYAFSVVRLTGKKMLVLSVDGYATFFDSFIIWS